MKRKALSTRNQHPSFGLGRVALLWLLLDRFDASPTVMAVFWTLATILVIAYTVDFFVCESVELK